MKTRGKKVQKEEDDETGSEEGDAPESVSWSASKDAALKEIGKEKERIENTKKREKQLRIQREERSKQLKEARKAKELCRLPEEVLQKVAGGQLEEEDVVGLVSVDNTRRPGGQHLTFDSDTEDNLELIGSNASSQKFSHDGINVVVLPKETKKPKKIQSSAGAFLQQQLYGDRIPRLPTLKAVSLKRKGRTQKPAVKFAKKCHN